MTCGNVLCLSFGKNFILLLLSMKLSMKNTKKYITKLSALDWFVFLFKKFTFFYKNTVVCETRAILRLVCKKIISFFVQCEFSHILLCESWLISVLSDPVASCKVTGWAKGHEVTEGESVRN